MSAKDRFFEVLQFVWNNAKHKEVIDQDTTIYYIRNSTVTVKFTVKHCPMSEQVFYQLTWIDRGIEYDHIEYVGR